MKVIILGADGYYGKVLEERLRVAGHDTFGIDNLIRRNIDKELGTDSLTPLADYRYNIIDIKSYTVLEWFIKKIKPDAVVHLAEQRSAPYSQMSLESKQYTIVNNTTGMIGRAHV